MNPQDYGVELVPLPPTTFARNDVGFIDPTGVDHDLLGQGLKKAIYNYMHGMALDWDVRDWFDLPPALPRKEVPKTRVPRDKIARALGFI